MLLTAPDSLLLLVDLQARLVPKVRDGAATVANAGRLLAAARRLQVPVRATEHYPAGLGPLVPALRALLQPGEIVEKIHFAATGEPGFLAALPPGAVVIAGSEAHVCVLQTALGLRAAGRTVAVVADAVASRAAGDRDIALTRLARNGCEIVTTEMVIFEWLARAGTDAFRDLLPLVRD